MFDIAAELAKLHELEGAEFIMQLKKIVACGEFHPLKENKAYFKLNPKACEVLVFKGKQALTVKRQFALQKSFIIDFRKRLG